MLVLICTALAILCIAWINYINMTVARSMERAKEIGIRRASGAGRRQIVAQFLFESLVTNGIAFVLAIGLMEALMPAFNNLTGRDLGFSVWVTTSLGWMLLLIFALGVFLSGFYPATILSGIKPIRMLKGKFTHTEECDDHPQGAGGVAVYRVAGFALRDVDRVCSVAIYAECFAGCPYGSDAGAEIPGSL